MNLIAAVGGSKPTAVDYKDNRLIQVRKVDMDDHIGLFIAIDIAELYCYRGQAATVTIDIHRSNIADRFGGVPTHEFNNDSLTIEIDRNEVTGMPLAFVMPYICVCLIGAWNTITEIIVALVTPGKGRDTEHPQDNGRKHTHAKGEQPMHSSVLFDLLIWLCYTIRSAKVSRSSLLAT